MPNSKYINVLWVENDPSVTESLPREAEMIADLILHPVESWEEAEKELISDYNKWQAIILDAKCKFKNDDADLASRFLVNAMDRLREITASKGTIPWYVLSGQGEEDIRDLIPLKRLEWDASWDKLVNRPFYSKVKKVKWGDLELDEYAVLFLRIKDYVTHYSHELQLKNDYYPDVFKALDNLGLPSEAEGYLIDLLEPIHFKNTTSKDYNHRYIDLRKIFEHIFRSMVENGILPKFIVSKSNGKDEVNLSWSSIYLGCEQPKVLDETVQNSETKFWSKVSREGEPLLPRQLAEFVKSAVFQTGGAVHTSKSEAAISMNLDKYLPHVGMSNYMLKSLSLSMCDFILWYHNYLLAHPDAEINALTWHLTNQKI